MSKQQTAVEWLHQKLTEFGIPLLLDELRIIKEAKEMERQQIEDAFSCGAMESANDILDGEIDCRTGKQYYEKTYGTTEH